MNINSCIGREVELVSGPFPDDCTPVGERTWKWKASSAHAPATASATWSGLYIMNFKPHSYHFSLKFVALL